MVLSCALPVYWDASGITRVYFRYIGMLMELLVCTSGVLGC
jgi:hypothetical protein